MPQWTRDGLIKSLENPKENLYCFYGEEFYLVNEALRETTNAHLGSSLKDFNLDVFYANELNASQLIDTIEMLPVMAQRRVVILKGVHDLSAKDLEALLPILEKPIETTVLIMTGHKIDLRLKFFKKFLDDGVVIKFDRLYDNQVVPWIKHIVKNHNRTISTSALEMIQQWVGTSLTDIDNEIQKLDSYLPSGAEITDAAVREVVSKSRVESIFAFTDAVGKNDRTQALTCLAQLLDQGESPIGIVALCSRHVRILRTLKEGSKEGLSQAQLSSRAGVSPYFLRDYLEQSRAWTENQLDHVHGTLLSTDKALKSSPVSAHIWLENLVLKTCSIAP